MNSKIKPGIYQHFKGGIYEVIDIAIHSETLEEMVLYRCQKDGRYWVRPAEMWNETVERNGKTHQRFTYIGEKE